MLVLRIRCKYSNNEIYISDCVLKQDKTSFNYFILNVSIKLNDLNKTYTLKSLR